MKEVYRRTKLGRELADYARGKTSKTADPPPSPPDRKPSGVIALKKKG